MSIRCRFHSRSYRHLSRLLFPNHCTSPHCHYKYSICYALYSSNHLFPRYHIDWAKKTIFKTRQCTFQNKDVLLEWMPIGVWKHIYSPTLGNGCSFTITKTLLRAKGVMSYLVVCMISQQTVQGEKVCCGAGWWFRIMCSHHYGCLVTPMTCHSLSNPFTSMEQMLKNCGCTRTFSITCTFQKGTDFGRLCRAYSGFTSGHTQWIVSILNALT